MLGDNFVRLKGFIKNRKFNIYDSGAVLFKATLAIPVPDNDSLYQYINISAWGDTATQLGFLSEGTFIKIQGHIEKSSFDASCRYCGGSYSRTWVEVVIDNFILIGDRNGR